MCTGDAVDPYLDYQRQLVEARRNRRDDWYLVPAGYIDLCNVPIVARPRP